MALVLLLVLACVWCGSGAVPDRRGSCADVLSELHAFVGPDADAMVAASSHGPGGLGSYDNCRMSATRTSFLVAWSTPRDDPFFTRFDEAFAFCLPAGACSTRDLEALQSYAQNVSHWPTPIRFVRPM